VRVALRAAITRTAWLAGIGLGWGPSPLWPQASIASEREAFATWLATAPVSPLAAIAQQPIGTGLRLGPPDADVPLEGIVEHRVSQTGGAATIASSAGRRALPRGLPVRLDGFTLVADGPPGRAVLTVFGPRRSDTKADWFPPGSPLVFVGPLTPPESTGTVRVLGADGVEVTAAEAGTVVVPIGGRRARLLVRRLPTSGGEESELEIFFRDATNSHGTYPAGRFVTLVPEGPGRYRLDFNRARNPFCAYSSAYACPAPWRGNTIDTAVTAGERYAGSSASAPGDGR
jgi:uncharacterized protein